MSLPFKDNAFDKAVSVTAFDFIQDGRAALGELFRVTRKGGWIVVATLNSLSPWSLRRKAEAKKGHALFEKAIFRSPDELSSLAPVKGVIRTAVHFQKEEEPGTAAEIELDGRRRGLMTGAFLVGNWQKP
jgi:ubiquinone/menaquinone biosynthesis C-methylase UbiE